MGRLTIELATIAVFIALAFSSSQARGEEPPKKHDDVTTAAGAAVAPGSPGDLGTGAGMVTCDPISGSCVRDDSPVAGATSVGAAAGNPQGLPPGPFKGEFWFSDAHPDVDPVTTYAGNSVAAQGPFCQRDPKVAEAQKHCLQSVYKTVHLYISLHKEPVFKDFITHLYQNDPWYKKAETRTRVHLIIKPTMELVRKELESYRNDCEVADRVFVSMRGGPNSLMAGDGTDTVDPATAPDSSLTVGPIPVGGFVAAVLDPCTLAPVAKVQFSSSELAGCRDSVEQIQKVLETTFVSDSKYKPPGGANAFDSVTFLFNTSPGKDVLGKHAHDNKWTVKTFSENDIGLVMKAQDSSVVPDVLPDKMPACFSVADRMAKTAAGPSGSKIDTTADDSGGNLTGTNAAPTDNRSSGGSFGGGMGSMVGGMGGLGNLFPAASGANGGGGNGGGARSGGSIVNLSSVMQGGGSGSGGGGGGGGGSGGGVNSANAYNPAGPSADNAFSGVGSALATAGFHPTSTEGSGTLSTPSSLGQLPAATPMVSTGIPSSSSFGSGSSVGGSFGSGSFGSGSYGGGGFGSGGFGSGLHGKGLSAKKDSDFDFHFGPGSFGSFRSSGGDFNFDTFGGFGHFGHSAPKTATSLVDYMAKPGEVRRPASNILDSGVKSNLDLDAGILGSDTNLFERVSKALMTSYSQGNLN